MGELIKILFEGFTSWYKSDSNIRANYESLNNISMTILNELKERVSEVEKKERECEEQRRVDAENYQKRFLELESQIQSLKKN